jgi:hypothetical protein
MPNMLSLLRFRFMEKVLPSCCVRLAGHRTFLKKYSTTSKGDSCASIIVRKDASLVAGLRTPGLMEWLAPTNLQSGRALTATRSVAILQELQLQFPTASNSLA